MKTTTKKNQQKRVKLNTEDRRLPAQVTGSQGKRKRLQLFEFLFGELGVSVTFPRPGAQNCAPPFVAQGTFTGAAIANLSAQLITGPGAVSEGTAVAAAALPAGADW